MKLEAHAIRVSLWLAVITAVGLLVRMTVSFGMGAYLYLRPWGTVIAALILLVGAIAGLRGRTWGVLAAGVAATAFIGAALLSIGPLWFLGVSAIAIAPTLASARRLFGFDPAIATAAVAVAVVIGGIAALFAGPGLELLGFY